LIKILINFFFVFVFCSFYCDEAMTDPERVKERRQRRAQRYLASLRWERTRRYVEQYTLPHGGEFTSLSVSQPQLRKMRILGLDSQDKKTSGNISSINNPHRQIKSKETEEPSPKIKRKSNPPKKTTQSERIDDSIVGHEADLDDSRIESPQLQRSEKSQKSTQKSSPTSELVTRALLRFKRTDSTPENISNSMFRERQQPPKVKINLKDIKAQPPSKEHTNSSQQLQQGIPSSGRSVSSEIASNPHITESSTNTSKILHDENSTKTSVVSTPQNV
jgi:hypothetical protein